MAQNCQQHLPFRKKFHRSKSSPRSSAHFSDVCQPYRTRTFSSTSIHQQDTEQTTMLTMTPTNLWCDIIQQQQITVPLQKLLETQDQFDTSVEETILECAVCATEKLLDEFQGIYGDTCGHIERTVCNSCVYEKIKCLIEDFSIYDGPVACLEPNCRGTFNYHEIREIILFIGKNDALFEQYDQRLILRHLEQMPEFVWCAHNCGSGQLYDPEGSSEPMVTCTKCKQHTCFKHRIIWHTDMSCDQYDLLTSQLSGTDASHKWLELFTKQCPKCEFHIQKNEGCDHMTCRYCKHEFCWECLVDYKLIATKGHSQHNTSCSNYQPDPASNPEATPPAQT